MAWHLLPARLAASRAWGQRHTATGRVQGSGNDGGPSPSSFRPMMARTTSSRSARSTRITARITARANRHHGMTRTAMLNDICAPFTVRRWPTALAKFLPAVVVQAILLGHVLLMTRLYRAASPTVRIDTPHRRLASPRARLLHGAQEQVRPVQAQRDVAQAGEHQHRGRRAGQAGRAAAREPTGKGRNMTWYRPERVTTVATPGQTDRHP